MDLDHHQLVMEFSEVLTVLARDAVEEHGRWFRLRTKGNSPSPRVGHSASLVITDPDVASDSPAGKIYCIGGANPDRAFDDAFTLDLGSSVWEGVADTEIGGRYEHGAASVSQPRPRIWVFGGANENGNLNDVREFDPVRAEWTEPAAANPDPDDSFKPTPRTQHSTAILNDQRLVVFGGGSSGSEPVDDQNVYLYDTFQRSWACIKGSGCPPQPRQGHLVQVINNKVYIHGGMSGDKFFDDMHQFDVDTATWTAVQYSSVCVPRARASHGGISHGSSFYVFGGLTLQGPVNDFYLFNTDNREWSQFSTTEDFPSSRLNFAFCAIPIVRRESRFLPENSKDSDSTLFFVHGGMDVSGIFFDDVYVCYLCS